MKQQIKCPHCNKLFPIEDSLKRLDRKYPNLVGRWVINESNYLSTLNIHLLLFNIH